MLSGVRMGKGIDARDFHFAGFRLESARGTLSGPDGQDHRIRPKTFSLLVHLLENPGLLHGRQELLEAVWPGIAVTDDSLTQCISELRKAFGAQAEEILRTVPRRGYILIAEVKVHSWNLSPASPSSPATPPFSASKARDREEARHASVIVEIPDGIAQAEASGLALLSAELARYEDLRVRRAAGREHADYRVRLVDVDGGSPLVFLDEASTNTVLWSEPQARSEEAAGPIDSAREILANRIARQVAVDSRRKARNKAHHDRTARDLCLLAADHHQRATERDTLLAIELLESAVALDPDYAQARAWLAYAIERGFTQGWGPVRAEAARDTALSMARAALILAPYSPLCLSRLAYCMMLHGKWSEAESTARMALNGPYRGGVKVRISSCEVLAHAVPGEDSIELMKAVLKLDPFCGPTVYSVLGRCLLMAGRPAEALPHLRWCATRLPDYAPCHHSLVMACVETGNMPDALLAWREIQRIQPGWDPTARTGPWFFGRPADEQRMLDAVEAVRAVKIR